jgi:diacylglycerol kinase family enzyme
MRVIVLTNPAAGAKADEAEELTRVLSDAGVSAQVRQAPGHQLTDLARAAIDEGVEAIVAAGGDGTTSAVAAALVGTKMPLGILPTGTLNHFAKDLGIPGTLADAARVIAAGQTREVDVASLNDRPFINNSSIGIYPHMVGERERQRERLGRGKWVAMLIATISVFRRHPTVRVRIGIGNQTVLRTTPFVFVGNNRYQMNLTMLGRRERLDEGILSLYFVNRSGRFAFFRLALRMILGRLQQSRDFETMEVTEVWIEAAKRSLRVALDGEVIRLPPPLHYEVRPRALRVLAPSVDELNK